MTDAPSFEQLYFRWLYEQVCRHWNSPDGYTFVCSQMNEMVFNPSVPNDDNRAAWGKDLRSDFLLRSDLPEEHYTEWLKPPATIFETLVGLTSQAQYVAPIGQIEWFDVFLANLGLIHLTDGRFEARDTLKVNRVLRKFNLRKYAYNGGKGGLFPLKIPNSDQREVELWYQMHAYISENGMF